MKDGRNTTRGKQEKRYDGMNEERNEIEKKAIIKKKIIKKNRGRNHIIQLIISTNLPVLITKHMRLNETTAALRASLLPIPDNT